jgi:hypothetical protein
MSKFSIMQVSSSSQCFLHSLFAFFHIHWPAQHEIVFDEQGLGTPKQHSVAVDTRSNCLGSLSLCPCVLEIYILDLKAGNRPSGESLQSRTI